MTVENNKLSYRRGTARRAISAEILSIAAHLFEKFSNVSVLHRS